MESLDNRKDEYLWRIEHTIKQHSREQLYVAIVRAIHLYIHRQLK